MGVPARDSGCWALWLSLVLLVSLWKGLATSFGSCHRHFRFSVFRGPLSGSSACPPRGLACLGHSSELGRALETQVDRHEQTFLFFQSSAKTEGNSFPFCIAGTTSSFPLKPVGSWGRLSWDGHRGLCKSKGASRPRGGAQSLSFKWDGMCDFIRSSEGTWGVLCSELQPSAVGLMGILMRESMSREIGVKQVSFQTFEMKCQSIYIYLHRCSMCTYVYMDTVFHSSAFLATRLGEESTGSQSVVSRFEAYFSFPGDFTADKLLKLLSFRFFIY